MWTGTILFVVSSISANSLLTLVVFPVPGRPRQTVLSGRPPFIPGLIWNASSRIWVSRKLN